MKGRLSPSLILAGLLVHLFNPSSLAVDRDVMIRSVWPPTSTSANRPWVPGMAVKHPFVFSARGGDNVEVIDFTDFSRPTSFNGAPGIGVRCVAVDGDVLFVADDEPTLKTYDISNPRSPQLLGSTELSAPPAALSLANGFAYIASAEYGLQIVEVQNAANPVWRGDLPLQEHVLRIAAANGHAYVVGQARLYDVDVSNPAQPAIAATLGLARDVAISGNLLFVAQNGGLAIYDTAGLALRGFVPFSNPDDLYCVVAAEGIVYASSLFAVFAVDVTNPDAPRTVGSYRIVDGNIGYMVRSGSEVYLESGRRIDAVDMIAPSSPKLSGFYRRTSGLYTATVSGSYVFGIDYNGLPSGIDVIDVNNVTNPVHVARLDTTRKAWSIDVVDNYGYIRFWDSFLPDAGMGVVDLKDPLNPRMVNERLTSEFYWQFRKIGSYALALGDGVLVTLDLTNPEAPQRVRQITTSSSQKQLIRDGSRAYIVSDNEIRIYNVADPLAVSQIGRISISTAVPSIYAVAARGNFAFVAGGTNGLVVFDVSNPSSTRVLAQATVNGANADGVWLHDDEAYVSSNFGGAVFDISDPSRPVMKFGSPLLRQVLDVRGSHILQLFNALTTVEIVRANPQSTSRFALAGNSEDVVVSGRYAYVAGPQTNLRVVDISDANAPKKVAELQVAGRRLAARGQFLYAVDPFFNVIDISDPLRPAVVATLAESAVAIALSDKYAFTVGEQNQSLTINITNAAHPFVAGRGPLGPPSVAAAWPYVYYGGSGLGIYDYSDPAAPKSVGGVNGFGTASEFDVFVRNGYAYSVGAFGLHVVDVSNPAKPNWIATFSAVNGRRVWVLGNFAYVIDHIGILHVFDVSNPARPLRVAGNSNVNTASGAQSWLARYGICAAADTLYLVSNNSFVISDVFRYSPAALQLTALAPSLPGSSRLRIAGPSGMNAHLERSTDLRTWEQVHSLILTDLPKDFIDAGSSSGYSFYRLTAP